MKTLKKTRAHQRYYLQDGTQVPGVTTILGVVSKPALYRWYNRMGLQGIDTAKYVDVAANIGTVAHYLIECDIAGRVPDTSEYAPAEVNQAENGYLRWLDFKKGLDFVPIASEYQLVSEEHRYGGTLDVYCKIEGKYTVLDIKTSGSGIYPEMRVQAVAYARMLQENGKPVENILIVRVGKDENGGVETAEVGDWEKHFDFFLTARKLYELQKAIK